MSGGKRSDKILDLPAGTVPEHLFAISLDLALQIPRDWKGLVALPGLKHLDRGDIYEATGRTLDGYLVDLERVRFVEVRDRDRWSLVPDDEDAALGGWDAEARRNAGVWCVGQRLDMTYMSRDQQRLFVYLTTRYSSELSPAEKAMQSALLGLCPREVRLPPIDLDAETESKNYSPERAREEALRHARAIRDYVAAKPELGVPYFYCTNAEKGSVHVDFIAPEGVKSAYLCEAWGLAVIPMLVRLGIPVNTVDLAGIDKSDRPIVVGDGSVYRKYPYARGGLWRPPGASKEGKEQPKTRIPDLDAPSGRSLDPKRPRDWTGRTVSPALLAEAVGLVAASPDAIKRRESAERQLRLVLAGKEPRGVRAERPDLFALSFAPGAAQPEQAAATPAPADGRRRRVREATSVPGEEIGNVAAASKFAEAFRRLPYDGRADAAAAACMLGRYPADIVAAGLAETGRRTPAQAREVVDGLRFQDHGDAWRFVVAGLGDEAARALVADLHLMRQVRSRSFYVPPSWATAMLAMVAGGMRPLNERDIPNDELRRYVQSDDDLVHAWFRVTGDRSGDESAFAKACHRTGVLSAEETIYLCVLKPGSKSGSDQRGREYAEDNVVAPIEDRLGPFGPGLTEAPGTADVDPAALEERRAERAEEVARIRAERAERAAAARRHESEEHARIYQWTTVHVLGDAPLPRTSAALAAARLELSGCTSDLHGAKELAVQMSVAAKAVACWLLAEGLPRAAAVGTMRDAGWVAHVAESAADDAEEGNGRFARPGEDWIKAKFPEVHAAVAPVLSAELLERNQEARRAFIQERDGKVARAHLAQAAGLLPDAELDGACRAHAATRHEHGPGCGDSCGHGSHERPPDEPPKIAVGGPPPLYRLANRLKQFFVTPSKVHYGPKAAATVLSFLLGFGMPGTVAASTFRHAGLPEAEHVWDTLRENARKHPEALRAAVTKEVGERAVSRMVASIERDLVMGADNLDSVTRSRLYQNFVGRWSLLPEERDYMLVLAGAAKERKPTRLPGMSAAERAAEHALNERIRKTRRGLQYAAKCGIFRQYMKCPTHGDRGSRALVTDREIMCRHCAWRWARGYRDWIAQQWPEKVNLVKVEVPAWSAGPGEEAPFEARDHWRTTSEHMREVSVAASRVKSARWGDVYDRVTAGEHEPPPETQPEQADEGEADEDSGAWSKWVVGTRPTEDQGFQALNRRPKRWVYGRDHFLVIMPIEVVDKREVGAKVIEHRRPQGQYLHLFAEAHRRLGRKVTEPKPLTGHPLTHHEQHAWRYAVTREEAAKQVYDTLMSLNHAFDDMLRDRDPWLGYFEWLAPGIKRTTATDGGKQMLSWPDRDQIRKFMAESNQDPSDPDKEDEEVEGGRCDADVPDESDPAQKRTRKCRLACHVILAHEPTQTVIAQNTQGILYGIDDALARANELGVPETLPFDDLE